MGHLYNWARQCNLDSECSRNKYTTPSIDGAFNGHLLNAVQIIANFKTLLHNNESTRSFSPSCGCLRSILISEKERRERENVSQ